MKIGIDIDDVITNTSEKIKEYLYKYEKSGDGIKHIVEVMRGESPTQNIKNFFNEYMSKIFSCVTIKENAKEVIDSLINNGHEIILITSRGEERFRNSKETTLEYLKNHNISYSQIIFDSLDKQIACKENDIDIMIDDSVKTCELVNMSGIKTIVYTSKINKNINTNIKRVENWLELEKEINKMN